MLRLSTLVLLSVALFSCSSDDELRRAEYLDASYLKRLELPPDLLVEDSGKQLKIPKPTDRAMREYEQGVKDSLKK